MAYNAGAIVTQLKSNLRDFKAGIKKAKGELKGFSQEAKRQARSIKRAGQIMAGLGTIASVVGFKLAKLGSDANETQSRFDHVFDNMEDRANEWAENFANDFDQVDSEVKDWLASLEDTFEPMGVATNQAYKMSRSLTKLAVDLGSFRNLPTARVIEDIQSTVTGQHKTMRKYGVVITQARLKQEAITQGWIKEGEELSELQKIQARYNLILDGTQKAQGDYLRTQDSFANQLRVTKNILKDIGEELGQYAIPQFKSGLGIVQSLLYWFEKLPKPIKETTTRLGLMAGGVSAVVGLFMTFIGLIPQAQAGLAALNLSFGPFLAGGVIVAGLTYVLDKIRQIRDEASLAKKDISEIVSLQEAKEQLKAVRNEIKRLEDQQGDSILGPRVAGKAHPNSEKLQKLRTKAEELESKINEFEEQQETREAEREILDKMRKMRAKMTIGEISEEEYKSFLQEQLKGDEWSATTKEQFKLELDSLVKKSKEVNEEITDETKKSMDQLTQEARQQAQALVTLDKMSKDKYVKWLKEQSKNEKLSLQTRASLKKEYLSLSEKEQEATTEQIANINQQLTEEIKKNNEEWYDYELYLLKQEKKRYEEQGADKVKIEKWYQSEKEKLDKKGKQREQRQLQKERQRELKIAKFKLNQRKITKKQYIDILDQQLAAEKKYSDRWMQLKKMKSNMLKQIAKEDIAEIKSEVKGRYNSENKRVKAAITKLKKLTVKYKDNKQILELINEEIKKMKNNTKGSTNELGKVTAGIKNILNSVGIKGKEASEKAKQMADNLTNGLSEAIVQGKKLSDVFDNLLDQIAQMIIKESIVEPAVSGFMSFAGLTAHTGGLITANGLKPVSQALKEYHNGGWIGSEPLKPNEQLVKAENNELILTEDQQDKLFGGQGSGDNIVHLNITAMDSQDVMRVLTKDGGRAVAQAFNMDFNKNGETRTTIKKNL